MNSLKHGLLAKEVVIDAGEGQEDRSQFDGLLGQLRADLGPVGVLEEMLVERIAVSYWRLRRVLRCEVGEIRRRLDNASLSIGLARAEECRAEITLPAITGPSPRTMKNSFGLKHLISILESVEEDVAEIGHLSEYSKTRLFKTFGIDKHGFASQCLLFSIMATEGPDKAAEDPENYGDTPDPKTCTKIILELLSEKRKELEQCMELVIEVENLETDAIVQSLNIPRGVDSDRILRYETTIERQLYRAVSHLEWLQRQRKGDPVLPPISVNMTTGNQLFAKQSQTRVCRNPDHSRSTALRSQAPAT